jgi:tripartite ATP-independent transporter DctM subunit
VAAVAWALFLGLLWYRTLSVRMLVKISMDTIETTATVLFIVAAASIFAWVLTTTGVTGQIADSVLAISDSPVVFLLLVNLFLLFVGCFMETIAAITILVPVLLPIVTKLGIDPVHFGLVLVLNLMIGLLTPPVGMVLFILQKVSRLSFEATMRAVLPWLIPLLVTLAVITYVPQVVLWLPGVLYK